MKCCLYIIALCFSNCCIGQSFDTARYHIQVETDKNAAAFFTHDIIWRGADGASSIDLGNGKILWLFSDSFISSDSSGTRKKSKFVRNSIAIQDGYDLKTSSLKFYWNKNKLKPAAFFRSTGKFWFWTGHGTMIKDKLIIFLMKEHEVKAGLGFEAIGWYAVLISNPHDEPSLWKMKYMEGPETFGTIAGSAAVLKDEKYLYAYGAVEPNTHEVYLLRWELDDVYTGNIKNPYWWINGNWTQRKNRMPVPEPLFTGGTEYSVHYDTTLKKFIQVQAFGFGEGSIGIRMSDNLTGPWTEPYMFYKPEYPGVKKPFMYSCKSHPELAGDGIYITYNVNSFDFAELIDNLNIYFPNFISIKISQKNSR